MIDIAEGQTPEAVFAEVRERFQNGSSTPPDVTAETTLTRHAEVNPLHSHPELASAAQDKPTEPRQHTRAAPEPADAPPTKPPAKLPPIPARYRPASPTATVATSPPSKPKRVSYRSDGTTLTLHTKVNLERLNVSSFQLTRRIRNHEQILNNAGLATEASPAISITHGWRHRMRFFRRQNVVAITTPRRGKGTANRLRKNFSRALATAKLTALEAQKPDVYKALTLHQQQAHRDTRLQLRKYLMSGNGRHRFAKALKMKLFGQIDQVRMGRSKRMDAAKLGLSDWGNRSDWHQDTTRLLMEIEGHKDGYRGVLNDTTRELRMAKAAITKATGQGFRWSKLLKGERMSWGGRKRREIRRAEARAALQQIRLERLNNLRDAFRL